MSTATASKPARRALQRLAATLFLLVVGGGCTAVLSVDQYQSAYGELCSLLDGCYGKDAIAGCSATIEAVLRGTATGSRAAWIQNFADLHCLESCSSARRCLDLAPVCHEYGAACTRHEECCRFNSGFSDCNGGLCCLPKGVACGDKIPGACCGDAGACNPVTHTCGGTFCRNRDAACDVNAQCCSGVCKDRRCAEFICNDDGFNCQDDKDCCGGFCTNGKCGPPVCGQKGAGCQKDGDCCDGFACTAAANAGGTTTCQPKLHCVPPEGECSTDDQCCSHHCDGAAFHCTAPCTDDGGSCTTDSECCGNSCDGGVCKAGCSNGACTANEQCCSQQCLGGACAQPCNMKDCGHLACALGTPLDPTCNVCAAEVCLKDPYCCCGAWDSVCVAEATTCVTKDPGCP